MGASNLLVDLVLLLFLYGAVEDLQRNNTTRVGVWCVVVVVRELLDRKETG